MTKILVSIPFAHAQWTRTQPAAASAGQFFRPRANVAWREARSSKQRSASPPHFSTSHPTRMERADIMTKTPTGKSVRLAQSVKQVTVDAGLMPKKPGRQQRRPSAEAEPAKATVNIFAPVHPAVAATRQKMKQQAAKTAAVRRGDRRRRAARSGGQAPRAFPHRQESGLGRGGGKVVSQPPLKRTRRPDPGPDGARRRTPGAARIFRQGYLGKGLRRSIPADPGSPVTTQPAAIMRRQAGP